ncbi:MAG: GspE/PulE/PilB domain-containing protein [Thermoanaerobaculia bacterium]
MRRRIGDVLVGGKAISQELRDRALAQQVKQKGRLCTNLLELGGVREDLLLRALAVQYGVATCTAADLAEIRPDILRLVPAKLAANLFVVPFKRLGRNLSLAMRDPKDLPAVDEVSFLTGLAITPFVALDIRIQLALQKHYGIAIDPRYPDLSARLEAGGGMLPVPPPRTPRPLIRSSSTGTRPVTPDAPPSPVPAPAAVQQAPLPASLPAPSLPPPPEPDPVMPPPAKPAAPTEIEMETHEEERLRISGPIVLPPEPTDAVGGEEVAPLVEEAAPATLVECLSRADSRDEIAAAVLREAGRLLRRAALFIAQAERVIGWAAVPEPPDGLRSFSIGFAEPSLFASLRNTDGFYVGPCPDLPGNRRILEALGSSFPAQVAAVPVSLKGKSVLFLLGEVRPGETPPKAMELKRLGALTAIALEILLLRNKLRSL